MFSLWNKQQKIWLKISKLQKQLNNRKISTEERKLILNKIKLLEIQLKSLYENNPEILKSRVKSLEKQIDILKNLNREAKSLVDYCNLIFNKYAYRFQEEVNADFLTNLVDYSNIEISLIVDSFKKENYNYDIDFLDAVKKYYEYLNKNIMLLRTRLNLNFWLSAKEVIKAKSGFDKDISILSCAVFHALGDFSARVFLVELENNDMHFFVKTKYKKRIFIFDPFVTKTFDEFFNIESIINKKLKSSNLNINKEIYSFNRFVYDFY